MIDDPDRKAGALWVVTFLEHRWHDLWLWQTLLYRCAVSMYLIPIHCYSSLHILQEEWCGSRKVQNCRALAIENAWLHGGTMLKKSVHSSAGRLRRKKSHMQVLNCESIGMNSLSNRLSSPTTRNYSAWWGLISRSWTEARHYCMSKIKEEWWIHADRHSWRRGGQHCGEKASHIAVGL